MFDIEGSMDQQILAAGKTRPAVVFPEALDPRIIEAACSLTRFARPVFLATEPEVREVIDRDLRHLDPTRVAFALSESAFVEIGKRQDLVEAFARLHQEEARAEGREVNLFDAMCWASIPVNFGIMAVAQGHADTVVGGVATGEKQFFRPMLKALKAQEHCCEAGVFVLPDEHPRDILNENIVVFGDVGVNAVMTPETLAAAAVGTCAIARDLIPESVLPEIHGAIVSYSNRGSDEGPSPTWCAGPRSWCRPSWRRGSNAGNATAPSRSRAR